MASKATDEETDVVASLAVTLDGYVSRVDGRVDYLEKYPIEDFDFDCWVALVGALIMGRLTYEQTAGWGWIWGDRPTMVLMTKSGLPVPDGADIRFSSAPTAEAVQAFSAETPKRLWVFGGGRVVTEAMLGGAVDTLDITVIPESIGAGIPLFSEPYAGPTSVTKTVPYSNGAVRLVYDLGPADAS